MRDSELVVHEISIGNRLYGWLASCRRPDLLQGLARSHHRKITFGVAGLLSRQGQVSSFSRYPSFGNTSSVLLKQVRSGRGKSCPEPTLQPRIRAASAFQTRTRPSASAQIMLTGAISPIGGPSILDRAQSWVRPVAQVAHTRTRTLTILRETIHKRYRALPNKY
jgi:hypothetical protein